MYTKVRIQIIGVCRVQDIFSIPCVTNFGAKFWNKVAITNNLVHRYNGCMSVSILIGAGDLIYSKRWDK